MKSNFKVMYFFELLVTCLWIPFFHYFFKFYREGLEFGSEEYSSAIKLSFILIYRSEQMILFLSIAFGLLTINLFITVVFYFFMKNKKNISRSQLALVWLSGIQIIISLLLLNINIFYVFTLPLSFLSIIIVYVSYVISKNKYGKMILLEEEVLGIHGPFSDKNESEKYQKKINRTYDTAFFNKEIYKEDKQYYIKFYEKD